jgi:hypothetical protein
MGTGPEPAGFRASGKVTSMSGVSFLDLLRNRNRKGFPQNLKVTYLGLTLGLRHRIRPDPVALTLAKMNPLSTLLKLLTRLHHHTDSRL